MLISPDEINKSLSNRGWIYKQKKILKKYPFDTYIKGINFVNRVAKLAEKNNHHPEMIINWDNIEVSITSHEMGGVSTKCVNLANQIDNVIYI